MELARNLADLGWRQDVVFLTEAAGPTHERLAGIPNLTIRTCAFNPRRRLGFVYQFARLCRELRPDVVVLFSLGMQLYVPVAARMGGVGRVVACLQNPPPRDRRARRRSLLVSQLVRPFVTDRIACSEYVAQATATSFRLPRSRMAVVPNCCDVERIASAAAGVREARRDEGPVCGMVARLDRIKDQETLLRAFASFREKFPNAHLRVIGDGPRRGDLERLATALGIADVVVFTGTREDVAEQLGLLDVFAYATTSDEGFGIVLSEAMAAGVPIVATRVGPCLEVLDSGRGGLLVPPADPQALAEGMERLWTLRTLRDRIVKDAFALVRERYDGPVVARAIDRLLRQ